jgi:hypothetical protein
MNTIPLSSSVECLPADIIISKVDYTNLKIVDSNNLLQLQIFFDNIVQSDTEYNICSYEGMYYSLVDESIDFKFAINFEKNIDKVYYLNVDKDIFYNKCVIIGKLTNQNYFYYTSKFGDKGFNKEGINCGMCLILSTKIELLIEKGVDKLDKNSFLKFQSEHHISQ